MERLFRVRQRVVASVEVAIRADSQDQAEVLAVRSTKCTIAAALSDPDSAEVTVTEIVDSFEAEEPKPVAGCMVLPDGVIYHDRNGETVGKTRILAALEALKIARTSRNYKPELMAAIDLINTGDSQ